MSSINMQTVAEWLKAKRKEQHLSLRQAADKTGLSHSTIASLEKGLHPGAETITKLALGLGGRGRQGQALLDKLLAMAGYRRQRKGEISESVARLIDRVKGFNESELGIMVRFAELIQEEKRKMVKV